MGADLFTRRILGRLLRGAPIASLASLLLVACPSGSALEDSEAFNKACDAHPVFEESCSGSVCHGTKNAPSNPKGGIDLLSPGVEARLVGKTASYAGLSTAELSSCGASTPELLIDPAAPENSLLLRKLTGEHRCGDRMPFGGPLEDAALRCVRSFVFSLAESTTGSSQGGASSSIGGAALGGGK